MITPTVTIKVSSSGSVRFNEMEPFSFERRHHAAMERGAMLIFRPSTAVLRRALKHRDVRIRKGAYQALLYRRHAHHL